MSSFPERFRLDLTNRLNDEHRELVDRIVLRDFSPEEAALQQTLSDFAQELVHNRLPNEVSSYIFHNDDQDWQTHFMLREKDYSSNQLGISFIKFIDHHRHKAVDNEMPAKMLRPRVRMMLSDTRYCHCLYRERVQQLILALTDQLEDTHHFAISVIKNRRALQVSMRHKSGTSMAHFYTRDLLNIEQEQSKIFQMLRGSDAQIQAAVHH